MRVLLDVLLCPREGLAHVCTTDVAVLLTTPAARWPLRSAGQRRAGKRYHTVSVHLHAMVHSSRRSEDWFMFPTSEIVSRVIAAPDTQQINRCMTGRHPALYPRHRLTLHAHRV